MSGKAKKTTAKTIGFKWQDKWKTTHLSGDEIDAILYLYDVDAKDPLARRKLSLAIQDLAENITFANKVNNLTQTVRDIVFNRLVAKCREFALRVNIYEMPKPLSNITTERDNFENALFISAGDHVTFSYKWGYERTTIRLTHDEIDVLLLLSGIDAKCPDVKRRLSVAIQDILKHVTYRKKNNLTQILRNIMFRRLVDSCMDSAWKIKRYEATQQIKDLEQVNDTALKKGELDLFKKELFEVINLMHDSLIKIADPTHALTLEKHVRKKVFPILKSSMNFIREHVKT